MAAEGDPTIEKVSGDDSVPITSIMFDDNAGEADSKNGDVLLSSFHYSSSSTSTKTENHEQSVPVAPSTIPTNDINTIRLEKDYEHSEIFTVGKESINVLEETKGHLENNDLETDDPSLTKVDHLSAEAGKCLNHNMDSFEGPKVSPEDDNSQFSTENQVSEVSSTLEVRIKSDYIFTDTVSFNEKNGIKANIVSDSVKLELDDFSQGISLDCVNPHLEDGKLRNESRIVEDSMFYENPNLEDDSTKTDIGGNNDISEVAYSEKLNLDRSSGDDSLEEDPVDTKQTGSTYISIGDENMSRKTTFDPVREESFVDVVGEGLPVGEGAIAGGDEQITTSRMKRKFHGVDNKEELSKRVQTEKLKNCQPKISLVDTSHLPTQKHNLSLSDSVITAGAHEERSVPPSPKSPTNSLRIDRFLRPFTLKAVQEFLGKTGNIISFWMDPIKTHCYITYSSIQEAVDTRNALYNLQWPPNRGHLLIAEFVDQQEVKTRMELPPQTSLLPPIGSNHAVSPLPLLLSPHQQFQHCNQINIPPPPPLLPIPKLMEWLPPPPPLHSRPEPPLLPTLDDLFQKTKTQPRVYFMPLSDEEVAAKRGGRKGDDNTITT